MDTWGRDPVLAPCTHSHQPTPAVRMAEHLHLLHLGHLGPCGTAPQSLHLVHLGRSHRPTPAGRMAEHLHLLHLGHLGAHVASALSLHLVHLGHLPACAVETLCLHILYLGYLGPCGAPVLTPYTPWTRWVACGGSWPCTFCTLETLVRAIRCNSVAIILTAPKVQEALARIPSRDAILRTIVESTSASLTVLRVIPRACGTPGSPGDAPLGRPTDSGAAG